jgi:anti-sigma factor ChrR (cupin superfamily)
MKCREVNELLVAYLDGEVTPSEQTLIQAHLAGCDVCRKELAALSATQSRVSRSLQVRAAQAAPSPQAWSRLQARLAKEARPSPSWLPTWLQRLAPGVGRINQIFEGGVTMKKGFALTAIAALVIALSVMAFVPSVRAQAGEILSVWFSVRDGRAVISGPVEFIPLYPTYLPAGLQSSSGFGIKVRGEPSTEMAYRSGDQFVAITQTKAPADRALPAGQKMTVNNQPAVLVTGLKGTFEYGLPIPEGAQVETFGTPPAEHGPIAYTDGKRLTWYVGDVKVEMLSNLSEEEMLKIAESLVPAEAGEGEAPFQPPLDLPSGGERKVIETEGGHIIIEEGPIESNP